MFAVHDCPATLRGTVRKKVTLDGYTEVPGWPANYARKWYRILRSEGATPLIARWATIGLLASSIAVDVRTVVTERAA